MSTPPAARIERHSGLDCNERTIELEQVVPTVREMCAEPSATLYCVFDEAELRVSSSGGVFAVFLAIGDSFFDLVGDPSRNGMVNFRHGGQEAEHPARQVLDCEKASAVTASFLKAAGDILNDATLVWEAQL